MVSSFEAQNIYITNSETINTGDSYLHFGTTANGEAYINVCNCYNGTRMLEGGSHRPNVLYTDGMFASDCKKIVLTTDRDLIKDRVQAIDDEFLGSFVDKANHSGKLIDVVEVKKTASIRPFGSLYVIEIPQQPKQETLEDFIKKAYLNRLEDCLEVDFEDGVRIGVKWEQQNSNINALDFEIDSLKREIKVLKHQQEKLCDSEAIQRIRATLSDAEARRIIRTI
jgi:acetolactate synthase regulatory subunit